jgi:hypothetical protein
MTATTVLAILNALPALLKLIRELMISLQQEMGAGTGIEKKNVVLAVVEGVVGNEDVWSRVKGIFSWTIDCIAIFKPKGA